MTCFARKLVAGISHLLSGAHLENSGHVLIAQAPTFWALIVMCALIYEVTREEKNARKTRLGSIFCFLGWVAISVIFHCINAAKVT